MVPSLEDVLSVLTPERRARVEARIQERMEEALTLRDLRHAQHVTQERMAEWRGVEQENVSCIERHADLLRTTLASDVAAMGGTLRLIAESPNRKPVMVALGDLSESTSVKPRRRSRDPKAQPATSQHPSSSPHPCKPCRGASRICLYRGPGDGPSGEGSTPLSLAMTKWGVTPLFIPGKTLMCLYQRCGRNQRRDSRDI